MGYSRQAGGTHPTEMLSSLTYISGIKYVHLKISLSQNQPSIGTSEYCESELHKSIKTDESIIMEKLDSFI